MSGTKVMADKARGGMMASRQILYKLYRAKNGPKMAKNSFFWPKMPKMTPKLEGKCI